MIPDHLRVARFTIQIGFHCEIIRSIFEGGIGSVSGVEQSGARGFVKRMAIKTIRLNFAGQEVFIENLIGEAALAACLIQANIVQTCRLGGRNAVCFTRTELLRGVNGAIHAPACRQEPPLAGGFDVFNTIRINPKT